MRAAAMAVVVLAMLASQAGAAGPVVDEGAFRYARPLDRQGAGMAVLEPDRRLFAHTRPGFADLRIVTSQGEQVSWRPLPQPPGVERRPLAVVYRGSQGGKAVALLDAGPRRPTLDAIELDLPPRSFVGRAEVLATDDRETFTRLSSTVVYDISGAESARSTAAVFPPTSARYFLVRVSGVTRVVGATATVASPRARREIEPAVERMTLRQRPGLTIVTLDLGFQRVPVDRLRITAASRVYDRPLEVRESTDGRAWRWAASGRAFRLTDSVVQEIDVATASRYLRVLIENGDDAPLSGIRVSPVADSRAILVRASNRGPLSLLYGNATIAPPQYDFARLPVSAFDIDAARPAALGVERRNPANIAPPDADSFFEQHDWLVPALLGLAALGIGGAGLVAALRPRRSTRPSGTSTS